MITIEIRGDINRPEEGVFMSMFGLEDTVCSLASVRQALEANPNDMNVHININSGGGLVSEGMSIYDYLRTSGRNISTNIINECHSMAVCILLSAPLENRSANPNARALIHRVRAGVSDYVTADDALGIAQELAQDEDAILDIYAARTGRPREELEALMDSEQMHDAQSLLKYGFISKINSYNTNKKSKMATKKTTNGTRWARFLANARNALGVQTLNFDYTDTEGVVLFSTEAEEDTLAVGDAVTIPDGSMAGEFILADGRTVVVADGVVTEIREVEGENSARVEELESLLSEGTAAVEELEASNTALEAENTRLRSENAQLRGQVRSGGNPHNRHSAPGNKPTAAASAEEAKNKAREAVDAFRSKTPKN